MPPAGPRPRARVRQDSGPSRTAQSGVDHQSAQFLRRCCHGSSPRGTRCSGRRPCERAGEPEYLSNRCAYDRIRHDMRSFKSFATTRSAARISMLVLLCTLVWLGNGRGADAQLDASWTPSGDGPLPLSDNYRSTLRKLCRLLELLVH